jgi:hypothetical protein
VPLYHFHLHNRIGFVPDEEGRELPDLETARAEAVKAARALIADEVLHGHLELGSRLDVTDAADTILFTLRFGDAVDGPEERTAGQAE